MNLFDGSHDKDFSHLLNEVAKKNLVHYAEELISRHPNFKKRVPRKKLREPALSTALEKDNIALIKKLVLTDENNMIYLNKSPLERAIKMNSIGVMAYFLSFQKQQKDISGSLSDALLNSKKNTDTIRIFCGYDCVQNIFPEFLEEAIFKQNLEIVKYLVEEKGVKITDEHLKSCETHNDKIIQWNTLDIPNYLLDRSERDAKVTPDFIDMLFKQKDTEEQKELFTKIAKKINSEIMSPSYPYISGFLNKLHLLQSKNILFESFLLGIDDISLFLENIEKLYKSYLGSGPYDESQKNKSNLTYNRIINNIKSFDKRGKNVKG